MEWLNILIAAMGLSFVVFIYFKRDSKLKRQEYNLNKYQLEKNNTEKDNEKKAIIVVKTIQVKSGVSILRVYNKGKSNAKNVDVLFPENEYIHIFKTPCPLDILPTNYIEIEIYLLLNAPKKIDIEIKWSDEFKPMNNDKHSITL